MGEWFGKDWSGAPFVLFSRAHWIALGLVALGCLALLRLRQMDATWHRRVRYGLAIVLLVNETLWHLWNWTTGQWSIQTTLPLHLCSVLVFLSAWMLITENYTIYEFAYLLGIPGAMQALLTPDAGIYGFPHVRFFLVFISHGAIVISALYMTLVAGYRPRPASLWRVGLIAHLYMIAVGVINALIGSNYLYIAHKPATASILDALPPWPWYILWIEGMGIVSLLLMYTPFALQDRQRRHVSKSTANLGGL